MWPSGQAHGERTVESAGSKGEPRKRQRGGASCESWRGGRRLAQTHCRACTRQTCGTTRRRCAASWSRSRSRSSRGARRTATSLRQGRQAGHQLAGPGLETRQGGRRTTVLRVPASWFQRASSQHPSAVAGEGQGRHAPMVLKSVGGEGGEVRVGSQAGRAGRDASTSSRARTTRRARHPGLSPPSFTPSDLAPLNMAEPIPESELELFRSVCLFTFVDSLLQLAEPRSTLPSLQAAMASRGRRRSLGRQPIHRRRDGPRPARRPSLP